MEPERINDVDDIEINGWPLGLRPVNARLSVASTSNMTMSSSCTPSSTFSSSSGFDSESTSSFFPEKSTTLGSLIGIHSSSQLTLVQNDYSSAGEQHTGKSGRNRMLCSFLSCGRGLHEEDPLEVSPSLSHYLEMEGRGITQSMQEDVEEQGGDMGDEVEGLAVHSSDQKWTCSRSCGPSLQLLMTQQPSPFSPWNVFNTLSHHHSMRNDQVAIGSRLHNFWHGFCGKLSSSLAT